MNIICIHAAVILLIVVAICAIKGEIPTWVWFISVFCIILLGVFALGSAPGNTQANIAQTDLTTVSDEINTFKTVAHLDLSSRQDLELVSIDYENDVAIYRYVDPNYGLNVGDQVATVTGHVGTVCTVDAIGFSFDCEDTIPAGESGIAIINSNGTQIGCLSKRLETGKYFAIWN